jgi:hypothetical protein
MSYVMKPTFYAMNTIGKPCSAAFRFCKDHKKPLQS